MMSIKVVFLKSKGGQEDVKHFFHNDRFKPLLRKWSFI